MRPYLSIVCLLAASPLSACLSVGGGDCDPEPPVTVELLVAHEDVRSLPVLTSKKSNLLGIDVPDSHGEARVTARLTNADSVAITGLRFEQDVDGQQRNIQTIIQRKNSTEVRTGDRLKSQDTLSFFWRMKALLEYRLPDARPHASTVSMDWRFDGCVTQTGTASVKVPGTVKAAVSATNLRLVSAEAFKPDAFTGAQVKMAVASAVGDGLTNLKDASYTVTYFGTDGLPSVSLGLIPSGQIALQSGGTARTQFALNETLEVFSSKEPQSSPAPYAPAGQAVVLNSLDGGKALVTLKLTSSKQSQSGTTQVDTLTDLVDLR